MAFSVESAAEFYLLDTKLENIFINEFMTAAPGDYVKVYLLSLMYADSGVAIDNAGVAKQLAFEEEDVLKAWNYWESLGVIRKKHKDSNDKFHYDVEFLRIKEQLYGKKPKGKNGAEGKLPLILNDTALKHLFKSVEGITGRPLGGKEPAEIISWIDDYGASPDVIAYAYAYCVKDKKKDSYKYVGAVVKEWMSKQLCDVRQIENHLQEVDERHFLYKRVLKAMGFSRNATEAEKAIMDVWFGEMGLTLEKVLEACGKTSGISNPNFNYVDSVLKNRQGGRQAGHEKAGSHGVKAISIADIYRYYDMIRKQAEGDAAAKREEVYLKVPGVKEIDEELKVCVMGISKAMVSGNPDKKQQAAKYQNNAQKLSDQKAELLLKSGYSPDYTETKYRCDICKDSGIDDDNNPCKCFKEIQNEAEAWQNSQKNRS